MTSVNKLQEQSQAGQRSKGPVAKKFDSTDVKGRMDNATLKQSTKTRNMFRNVAAKRLEKRYCAFYHPQQLRLFCCR